MPANNRSAHPFIIIAGTMACLLALSMVKNSFSLQGFTSRRVDMLADIRKDIAVPPLPLTQPSVKTPAPPPDAAAVAGKAPAINRPVYDYMTYTGIQEYQDSAGTSLGMHHFLTALRDLKAGKRKKVRVAYFGDSMIEADLITGDLRDSLQAHFGGAGIGFVQITSVVATWRTTIRHTFSDNWTDYNFRSKLPDNTQLGICGHAFVPAPESWAKYGTVQKPGLDRFNEVYLLYGPSAGSNVLVNGTPYTLNGTSLVNELVFPQGTLQNSVMLQYGGGSTPPALYGLSFESESGVFVDNYSFRGITGLELAKLNRQMVQQMQQRHPYDLVVIHYGANILFRPELTDYNWYEQSMQKVMDSLCHNWPQTSFLVVGTADKGYMKNDHYVTAPGVRPLLKAQHALARDHGTAYWNLFAAMGGEGSMARWVQEEPAHGKKDHTHFTTYGASRVGALLYKAIMDEFRQEVHP
jgi:lysophospholipase L1-like esterase